MSAEHLGNGLVVTDRETIGVMVIDGEHGAALYRLRSGDRLFIRHDRSDELADMYLVWLMWEARDGGYYIYEQTAGEGRVFTRNGASLPVLRPVQS